MATLIEQYERARKLTPQKIVEDVFKFIKSIEKELVAYNVATLHQDSEDVDGNPIGFYSTATELITDGRKKAGEPFDLLESGDFLESIYTKLQKDSILFDASDPKKKEVVRNLLTNDVFGLQDADLKKVIETRVTPFYQRYLHKGLGI